MADTGRLKVQCFVGDTAIPVEDCKIFIEPTKGQNISTTTKNINTDSSGLTPPVELSAPPLEYSMNPSEELPYSLYDLRVSRDGFEDVSVRGVQVFPGQTALQQVKLIERDNSRSSRSDIIVILPNTLNGNYPAKIPENPDKPLPAPSSGVVLAKPVAPEFITVHQGSPNDNTAPNYTVQ